MVATRSQIPVFHFSERALNSEEGSEGWKSLCDEVREACEEYGCFVVSYDKVPMHLYDDVLVSLQSLFDLPEETKEKNVGSFYSSGYTKKTEELPFFQSMVIDNAQQLDATKAFTDLMWPQGNPDACRAFHSMAAKMFDLHQLVTEMIFQSLGVGQYVASHIETNHAHLRLIKYDPPHTPDSTIGLQHHTDETVLSILGENEVHGLKLLSKGGDWIKVQPSKGTFVVLVGDLLEAMSNGRFQAPQHAVDIAGERVRYSYGLFTAVKDKTLVEPFSELVDEEHPLRYRPFYYEDYIRLFKFQNEDDYKNSIKAYAGV